MRFGVVHCATRLLLALATVAAPVSVRAVTPAVQTSPDLPPPVPPPLQGKPPPVDHRPAKHPERADARKPQEQHGKSAGGKATGVPSVKGGPSGGAPAGDQKGRPPVVAAPPPAAPPPPAKDTGEPPPKIPRFAALKTDDTNMRKGPGQRYPIEWVYKRRDLPMEVEREYDVWRLVKDPEGIEGWVHQVTLSDRRTFIVQNKDATLRADPNDTAAPVATLKVGVIGRLRECAAGSTWCQVQVSGYRGYLRRDQFWGLLPDEALPS